jgi:hypothetical protein
MTERLPFPRQSPHQQIPPQQPWVTACKARMLPKKKISKKPKELRVRNKNAEEFIAPGTHGYNEH